MNTPLNWARRYMTLDPNKFECIGYTLWDRQAFAAGVQAAATTFFSATRKNLRDGNIPLAGQLPGWTKFLVRSIRMVPIVRGRSETLAAGANTQTGVLDDIVQIFEQSVVVLTIHSKPYASYPGLLINPGVGPFVNQAAAGTLAAAAISQFGTWGNPDQRNVYVLSEPLTIPPQTNFNVQLLFPTGETGMTTTAPPTTLTSMDIDMILDGAIIRPRQ